MTGSGSTTQTGAICAADTTARIDRPPEAAARAGSRHSTAEQSGRFSAWPVPGQPALTGGKWNADRVELQSRSAGHYLQCSPVENLHTTIVLAARATGFPVAMVNILDQWFQYTLAVSGGDRVGPMPRRKSLCDLTVRAGVPVVVPDARSDPRFADNAAVVRDFVRGYAAVPLAGRESLIIGTLCVLDEDVRVMSSEQLAGLIEFGHIIEDQLELARRLFERPNVGTMRTERLANAIADGQIKPWYQPIVDLATGRTVALEALARWRMPSGEVVEPVDFIPLAEESELIIELDLAVLREALQDLRRWRKRDPQLRMSVNLSGRHFQRPDCLLAIQQAAIAAGVPFDAVDLELTETTRLTGAMAVDLVGQLRKLGFRVWLDDFGTGWSTMESILQMPIDGVKIDQKMTAAIGTPVGDRLLRSLIGLAGDLGVQMVMEGIETQEAAQAARALGCLQAQGYLWSRPVPAADIESTLPSAHPTLPEPGGVAVGSG